MTEDVIALTDRVLRTAKDGPLADAVSDVQVEPDRDEDGEDFLRVELTVHLPKGNVDAELEALLERIEETVAAVDDRYASVRFLDAA